MDNPLHPLHLTLVRQRSTFSKRLLQLRCHNNRYRKSFLPQHTPSYNNSLTSAWQRDLWYLYCSYSVFIMLTSAHFSFFWVYLYIYITCGSIIAHSYVHFGSVIAHSFELFIFCTAIQTIIVYSIVCTVYIHCTYPAFYLCYVQSVFLFLYFLWTHCCCDKIISQSGVNKVILFYSIKDMRRVCSNTPEGPEPTEN